MCRRSIVALALLVGLLCAVAAFAEPPVQTSPAQPDFPSWLAATSGEGAGTPAALPMAFTCQPNGTFCQQAACSCAQRGGSCLCGGVLSGCNAATHVFSCLCFQCGV